MAKKLIINCDDLGPNPHVKEALIRSLDLGLITSASVITNYGNLEEIRDFHQRHPHISLGIHLNFTSGPSVLQAGNVRSLLNDKGLFYRNLERKEPISLDELKREFIAQFERLKELNISPSHIDNHHPEIYFHPVLFEVILAMAQEFKLPVRVPFTPNVMDDIEAYSKMFHIPPALLKKTAETVLDLCEKYDSKHPDYFYGSYTFGDKSKGSLIALLDGLKDGISELCVHPATDDPALVKELEVLTDPDIREHLKKREIELVSYRDLAF